MNHGENAVPRPTGNIFVRVAVLVLLIAAFVLSARLLMEYNDLLRSG